MRLVHTTILAALLFLLGASGSADGGEAVAVPPPGRYEYAVVRDGRQIGVQTLEFAPAGDDEFIVRIHADVAVTFLGIPVYRYEHDAEEHWRGGLLVRLQSRTDSNGKPRRVDLKRVGDRLVGTYNNDPRELPGDLIPASLWHPATIHQTVLLDAVKGVGRQVHIADRGKERIAVNGETVEAHRYSVTGELEREIWYGADGQIVRVQVISDDGSLVAYVPK